MKRRRSKVNVGGRKPDSGVRGVVRKPRTLKLMPDEMAAQDAAALAAGMCWADWIRGASRAQIAADTYKRRTAEIRSTMDSGTREFADAMSAACAEYERAMVADIGADRASELGASPR